MPATITRLAPPPAINSRNGAPNASQTAAPRACGGNSRTARRADEPAAAHSASAINFGFAVPCVVAGSSAPC